MNLRLSSPGWTCTTDLSLALGPLSSAGIEISKDGSSAGPLALQIDGLTGQGLHEIGIVSTARTIEVSFQGPGDACPSYVSTVKATAHGLEDGRQAFKAIVSIGRLCA